MTSVSGKLQGYFDDAVIDNFARKMKYKMTLSREKGREGWHDPERSSIKNLQKELDAHIQKGDLTDVAIYCAMIEYRKSLLK